MTATHRCDVCQKKTTHVVVAGAPGTKVEGVTGLRCVVCGTTTAVSIQEEPAPTHSADPDPTFEFQALMEHDKADLARLVLRLEKERDEAKDKLLDLMESIHTKGIGGD